VEQLVAVTLITRRSEFQNLPLPKNAVQKDGICIFLDFHLPMKQYSRELKTYISYSKYLQI
jgi:hypothetical protein